MRICLLPFPPGHLAGVSFEEYDLVIMPQEFVGKYSCFNQVAVRGVNVNPHDHTAEYKVFNDLISSMERDYQGLLGAEESLLIRRALYLSAIKVELRFFINSAKVLLADFKNEGHLIDAYYRYFQLEQIFSEFHGDINWKACNTAPRLRDVLLGRPYRLVRYVIRRTVKLCFAVGRIGCEALVAYLDSVRGRFRR